LADDIGTGYVLQRAGYSLRSFNWAIELTFEPAVPVAASTLTLRSEAHSCEVRLPLTSD
jgi:hypothetical protein